MTSFRHVGVGWVAAAALLALVLSGAACKKGSSSNPDGGDTAFEVNPGDMKMEKTGDGVEAGPICQKVDAPIALGDPCMCKEQCASGFCVDGVCCNGACNEGCKTCNAAGTEGMCVMRKAGDSPRDTTTCAMMPVSTCGTDGKCDGAGGCRKYPENTTCKAGTCDGDAVVGSFACDGLGHCKPGSTRICVPYTCNPGTGACHTSCTSSAECVSGQACVMNSCGKLKIGATCKSGDQCASGFCADGVCCNVACQGPCLSCNLMGREGRCWPLDADVPDTRGICRDQGKASCGQTGFCDGVGGCKLYPRDTVCVDPTCSGVGKVNTAGTCNGLGTCLAQGIQDCHPFRCASGVCTKICNSSADCDTGIACVSNSLGLGTCGPKMDGQPCSADNECQNSHCVDGVCCDTACTGACRKCNVPSSLGRCTPTAAGTVDPRGVCAMTAQSTCMTNGKCDGNFGCQKWPVGTLCADETCSNNVYKAPSTCNASGQCVAPDLLPCAPYVCNGSRCFNACTNDTQCLNPPTNQCRMNSCGKGGQGATCSSPDECQSGFCAQGVCCDSACNTACKSCVAGMLGVCSNVATGANDPSGMCAVQASSTCGTNGKCEAGACQRWGSGTPCKPATCPSTSNQFTPLSTCDGSGTCVTPPTTACFPYTCGGNMDACNAICTVDSMCQPPAVCVNGSCGLKPKGSLCTKKEECLSNFCEQGVCCETACTGVCKSCALTASLGVCSNIAAGGVDLQSRCADQGAASCGTDGFCDGRGACRLYSASTPCAPASCATGLSTLTTGRTCNGLGVCQPAANIPCNPYVCNGTTACLAACTRDADCLAPNICDPKTNRCGNLKRPGQACVATSECLTGYFCTDGVCCVSGSCSLCQACNVGASAGSCANVPLGTMDPMNRCTPSPPCGNTGACNGAGGCQLAATTVSCGTETCTGSTYTPISHCNGTGTCATATSSSCGAYLCGGTTCRNTCSMDSHCLAPNTCLGTPPSRNCALKPPGTACTAGNQCISGNCVNSVCCGSPSCGTCQTCNGSAPGTCTPLAAGTAAPTGQCTASPPCGNTGTCNGASACTQGTAGIACGAGASCTGSTYQPASTCNGSGTCSQPPGVSCGNYNCSAGVCLTSCTADSQCSSTSLYCSTAATCLAKKANGMACNAAKECTSNNCTDGVCCGSATCGTCQTCNGTSPGTCTALAAGTPAPAGQCTASPPCGNTGTCNGASGCTQGAATVSCGAAEMCTGTTYQPPSTCTGSGACNQKSPVDCGMYACNTNNKCRTTCSVDTDCAGGSYCAGTSCAAKKGPNAMCSANNECASTHCTDGVCCSTDSCPTCQACNLNGAGTCSNVGVTTPAFDPHLRCGSTGSCGNTGLCANGLCQQQPMTTPCGPSVSCAGGMYQQQSFCNGSGGCSTLSPISCGAYACNGAGNACLASCNFTLNGDNDCASGYYCSGGTSGMCLLKKSPGPSANCSTGHECTTGNCVDCICCNSSICGTCQTCASGSCANLGNGATELHGMCPNNNPPCGNTGTCTNGACTQGTVGIQCIAASCADTFTVQPKSTCNGSGACVTPSTQPCSPYTCGGGSCQGSCANDGQCAGTHYCDAGGVCRMKRAVGDQCGRDGECGPYMGNSTYCTDGVCCTSSSCGSCATCAFPTMEGTCHLVGAGAPDPTPFCANLDTSVCGTDGTCNLNGSCHYRDGTTQCATPSCDSGAGTYTRTYCNGIGMCADVMTETCSSGMCDSNGCTP